MPDDIPVDMPTQQALLPDDALPTKILKKGARISINRRFLNGRVVWLAMAILYLTPLIISLPVEFNYLSIVCPKDPQCAFGPNPYPNSTVIQTTGLTVTSVAIFQIVIALIAAAVFISIGFFLIWRKPDDRTVFFIALTLLTLGADSFNFTANGSVLASTYPALGTLFQIKAFISSIIGLVAILIFPGGYFALRWTSLILVLGLINEFLYDFIPDTTIIGISAFAKAGLFVVLVAVIILVQIYRYRRLSTPIQRQQTKWVIFGLAIGVAGYTVTSTIFPILISDFLSTNVFGFLLNITVEYVFILFFPMSFAVAILSSRLWDIDILINRSLVYGALTVLLAVLFGLILVVSNALFQNSGSGQQTGLALLAAGLLFGGIFNPARRALQRFVDRRFYHIYIDYHHPRTVNKPVVPITGSSTARQIGPFELLELLGRGGMGEVHKARHTTLRRIVAVKLLPATHTEDADYRRRFEREARIVAALKHPNIVQVFDFGEADGLLYMSMEYITGSDMGQLLKENGRLSQAQAIPILRNIADALDYAHSQGLVHRDIKAANIMLEPVKDAARDNEYRAVLMDFGIAKMDGGTQLTQGNVVGTLDYIAPEQIQDSTSVDARADIYAFGVLCYQILTGTLPFKNNNLNALLIAHLHQPAPDPRTWCRTYLRMVR